MMKMIKLVLLFFIIPISISAQHTITATFSPAEDFSWAILYKTTPTSNGYVAQGKITDGKVIFNLDSEAKEGIYKLTFAVPQEEYNFDIIYNKKEDVEVTYNEKEGAVFQTSSENILLNEYLQSMSLVNTQIGEYYVQLKQDTTEVLQFFNQQRELQKGFEKQSEGTIVHSFIKANRPYIPTKYEDDDTYIVNLTSNYFSYLDFNDPVLQSSRLLMDRVIGYSVGVIPEGMDRTTAFNRNIDFIEQQLVNTEKNYHKIFLDRLWGKLVLYRLTDNANYLAVTYLIPLAEKMQDPKLANKLINFKNLSIGNVAPDFSWEEKVNGKSYTKKLSDLTVAENYILIFWSSTCSHCLAEIPKLNEFLKGVSETKYKVIALGLEENPINWNKQISKYPNFIHVIGLGKWENEIGKAYDITGTPTYFVLDKEKRFILKPDSLEELEEYLNKNK